MINRTQIKKLPYYGKSRIANDMAQIHFRVRVNGTVDSITMTSIMGEIRHELQINNTTHLNTYKCEDAVLITSKEWRTKVSELKKSINSFR